MSNECALSKTKKFSIKDIVNSQLTNFNLKLETDNEVSELEKSIFLKNIMLVEKITKQANVSALLDRSNIIQNKIDYFDEKLLRFNELSNSNVLLCNVVTEINNSIGRISKAYTNLQNIKDIAEIENFKERATCSFYLILRTEKRLIEMLYPELKKLIQESKIQVDLMKQEVKNSNALSDTLSSDQLSGFEANLNHLISSAEHTIKLAICCQERIEQYLAVQFNSMVSYMKKSNINFALQEKHDYDQLKQNSLMLSCKADDTLGLSGYENITCLLALYTAAMCLITRALHHAPFFDFNYKLLFNSVVLILCWLVAKCTDKVENKPINTAKKIMFTFTISGLVAFNLLEMDKVLIKDLNSIIGQITVVFAIIMAYFSAKITFFEDKEKLKMKESMSLIYRLHR